MECMWGLMAAAAGGQEPPVKRNGESIDLVNRSIDCAECDELECLGSRGVSRGRVAG